eukprot:Sdes_comp8849_c0_seq1m241
MSEPLIQYILVRKDLLSTLNWTFGSLAAQCCHASVAVLFSHAHEEAVVKYTCPDSLQNMRKIVLQVQDETCLLEFSETLKEAQVFHHLWIEEPEHIPTCLATIPLKKSVVKNIFKRLQLFR